MDDEVDDLSQKKLDAVLAELRQHFDQVQILAIREDSPNGTAWAAGYGNIYARVGLARYWADDPDGFTTE